MSRALSWRRICPDVIRERVEAAKNTRLLFISRSGPTGFVVKDPSVDQKYKVLLGGTNSCTCPQFRKERESCVHILWILVKKLRVSESNPILWQLALIDREVQELLRGSEVIQQEPTKNPKNSSDAANAQTVEQRPIGEDEVCAICQCEMNNKKEKLVFCRFGCGMSLHGSCLMEWAKHAKSQGELEAIQCPLCRVSIGSYNQVKQLCIDVQSKPGQLARREDAHLGHKCGRCKKSPIEGKLYLCRICTSFDLCQQCFAAGAHADHNFVCKDSPKAQARMVDRIALPLPLIHQLQQRELDDDDYHMLLLLDQPAASSVIDQQSLDSQYPSTMLQSLQRIQHVVHTHCLVCHQTLQPRDFIRKLGCGHVFHRSCIDPYLTQQRNACPIDGLTVGRTIKSSVPRQQSNRNTRTRLHCDAGTTAATTSTGAVLSPRHGNVSSQNNGNLGVVGNVGSVGSTNSVGSHRRVRSRRYRSTSQSRTHQHEQQSAFAPSMRPPRRVISRRINRFEGNNHNIQHESFSPTELELVGQQTLTTLSNNSSLTAQFLHKDEQTNLRRHDCSHISDRSSTFGLENNQERNSIINKRTVGLQIEPSGTSAATEHHAQRRQRPALLQQRHARHKSFLPLLSISNTPTEIQDKTNHQSVVIPGQQRRGHSMTKPRFPKNPESSNSITPLCLTTLPLLESSLHTATKNIVRSSRRHGKKNNEASNLISLRSARPTLQAAPSIEPQETRSFRNHFPRSFRETASLHTIIGNSFNSDNLHSNIGSKSNQRGVVGTKPLQSHSSQSKQLPTKFQQSVMNLELVGHEAA